MPAGASNRHDCASLLAYTEDTCPPGCAERPGCAGPSLRLLVSPTVYPSACLPVDPPASLTACLPFLATAALLSQTRARLSEQLLVWVNSPSAWMRRGVPVWLLSGGKQEGSEDGTVDPHPIDTSLMLLAQLSRL